MSDLVIAPRAADHPDAAALLGRYLDELVARLGEFDPARSASAAPDEMAPPGGAFLVAYQDGRAVACGGVKRLSPDTCEIKRMFVGSEARRRGVARRLLAALEAEAVRLGYRRVLLDTAAPLGEATLLYRAAGYGEVPPYNDNPYAAHWFGKDLG
jgi:GNAT superfamily N-acetyltransferase